MWTAYVCEDPTTSRSLTLLVYQRRMESLGTPELVKSFLAEAGFTILP